jgi:hypothetical protein
MSKSKSKVLLLPLVVLLTGLSITSLIQSPQPAHSQQDFEKYIITETNTEQKLNQKNIGSGSTVNLNCGTNVVASNSPQQITMTCQSIPGGTPTPGTTVIPVVTQRMAEIPVVPSGTTSGEAQCNPDEVVTGGGYEITTRAPGTFVTNFKELAVNNAWHIEIVNPSLTNTVRVYAECLKLVPS